MEGGEGLQRGVCDRLIPREVHVHEPRTPAQSDFEEEVPLRWRRTRNVTQLDVLRRPHHRPEGLTELLLQEVYVTSVRGVLVRDLVIERVGRHGQLPLRTPDAFVEEVDALVTRNQIRVVSNALDPLERRGQVDVHVRILDEGGDEHLEVGPGRLLVPCAFNNGIALGAQQTQGPHVTVKDIDGRETALEAVELEERDSTGRRVPLLEETRVVSEEQHLSVSQIHRLDVWFVIPKVAGAIEVSQELAHIAEKLVGQVGLTRPSPAIRKDDDEHRILRDCSLIGSSFWQCAARGHDERCSGALCLGKLLLQPSAPQETHG